MRVPKSINAFHLLIICNVYLKACVTVTHAQAWSLLSEPMSKENESACCTAMIDGCAAAMATYPASAAEDMAALRRGGLTPRQARL